MRLFSDKSRPVHLGPFPLEHLARRASKPDLDDVPRTSPRAFHRPDRPRSIVNAMAEYQAMLDAIRDGPANRHRAQCPADPAERARHLKAFGYFCDAAMVGIGPVTMQSVLKAPLVNPDVAQLADKLRKMQTQTIAAGIDMTMADLRDSMDMPAGGIGNHDRTIVFLYDYPRDPDGAEPGHEWIADAQAERACLRGSETAVVLANYIRLLGYRAKAHTGSASDVDLNRLAVAAGLAVVENGTLVNPFLGDRFGLAAVTTDFDLLCDAPLAPLAEQSWFRTKGPAWWIGKGYARNATNAEPYRSRRFVDGAHPFERLKRVETPTTYIDEANVARVPKRTDMFARALFGDMGPGVQKCATNGYYVRKAAPSMAQRRVLGAFVLLQDAPAAPRLAAGTDDPHRNADAIKAASYFLGIDAVGISRCPDWAYYSHDTLGEPIDPYHGNAISMIVDQGYETMEGASGDDWISVAQSMRAYLRFSLLGGVIANQIRSLGYSARVHSVMDGEVLQPPLLLLSGLGEVSRIGEVILNPFLGPRLKSGVVTTDMPMRHDKPIDFGLQDFCRQCNKCARECPSGAITAGPKLMFNGYEIWKSDSQKCATYRVSTDGGAMCGRCMKTCPWNLEGLFAEKPFRWAAMHVPAAAPLLARLDDRAGRGGLNPIKKWWWDLEVDEAGAYRSPVHPVNARGLQRDLALDHEDQTLAVYPANLAPHPWPYPFPMEREKGIEAYQALVTAREYRRRLAAGRHEGLVHRYRADEGTPPVLRVEVSAAAGMAPDLVRYELRRPDGRHLPEFEAGAHIDIVVAPEFLRQYSLAGDPADRSRYVIGVLREQGGRGGSQLLQRIFTEGRRVFISRPINHFPLDETAVKTILMGGGIGVTPMIAMGHRLHALGADFALHYSVPSRRNAGFLDDLARVPWKGRVVLHVSDEASRADLDAILSGYRTGYHVYVCGPDRYMEAAMAAAGRHGYPDEARHMEYFSVPELPDHENHPFTLRLARSGRDVRVAAEEAATDSLLDAGIPVDVKCSDGLCGVCRCDVVAGAVEHRDFVLSARQRRSMMILCRSRAAEPDGVVEIDL